MPDNSVQLSNSMEFETVKVPPATIVNCDRYSIVKSVQVMEESAVMATLLGITTLPKVM